MVHMGKLLLNAIYGKFATKTLRETKDIDYIKDEVVFSENREFKLPSSKYLPIGIVIPEYARMKLVAAVGKDRDQLLYTDTDSIAFTSNYKIKVPIGKELGEWDYVEDDDKNPIINKLFYIRHTKQYGIFSDDLKCIALKYAGINF
jgi:hypothetical protein